MADRPIIFSGPMVRALLAGRKTMTRRLATSPLARCKPGDRLWVRETFSYDGLDCDRGGILPPWYWADGNPEGGDWTKPRPSIHMPRWASRLTLIVTANRIERLNDISPADAMAEGAKRFDDIPISKYQSQYPTNADRWSMEEPGDTGECLSSARTAFGAYWIKLHSGDSWDANPEVVALTFRVERRNIDKLEAA